MTSDRGFPVSIACDPQGRGGKLTDWSPQTPFPMHASKPVDELQHPGHVVTRSHSGMCVSATSYTYCITVKLVMKSLHEAQMSQARMGLQFSTGRYLDIAPTCGSSIRTRHYISKRPRTRLPMTNRGTNVRPGEAAPISGVVRTRQQWQRGTVPVALRSS